MQETDLTKRHGDLIPERRLSNGLIRYRCARIRAHGQACGNVRDLQRKRARNYFCCVECASFLREQPRPRKKITVSLRNFTKIRARFTPEQWTLYYEMLGRRQSVEDQKDIVELVLLEEPGWSRRRAA
jgi:hypothetical protein